MLILISLVPAMVTWVICFRVGGIGGVVPGFTVWGVLTGVALGNERERDTPRGRAAASHWLGYRDYLVADKQFRTLPPAAVTIWDRHLAYAAAFGFARTAIEALPLATYNEHQAWTTFSGEWTQVRIVYCPARSWWGHSPRRLIWFMARRGLAGGVGLYLLFKGRSTGYDIDSFVDAPPNPILNDWAYRIGFGIAGIVLLLAVRCLVLAVTELRTREEYEGEVVRVREDPKYHYFFVAIADGKSPKVKAYRLFGWAETPEEGARVRIRAGRVLGYVTEIEEFVSARPGASSRRR